jgi:hypothetical protein
MEILVTAEAELLQDYLGVFSSSLLLIITRFSSKPILWSASLVQRVATF